jgi:hypothetical protein
MAGFSIKQDGKIKPVTTCVNSRNVQLEVYADSAS